MATIQIKHVPAETHAVLRRRAAEAHQSLQEYLLSMLVKAAATQTNAELFDRIEREGTGATFTFQDIVDDIEAEREGR